MGKLTKLKSVLKKLHSFGTLSRTSSSISDDIIMTSSSVFSTNLHPVYVGKSRRQYLISTDVIHHPLFQELVEKQTEISDDMIIVANCEVVLFDHLLWMLQNADLQTTDSSFDDLVHFYAC